MKTVKILFFALLVLIVPACHEKEVATRFNNPEWTYTPNTAYNVTMTATVQLPDNLRPYLSEDDQMVALVGDEVRGVAVPFTDSLFYITIHGSENEVSQVELRYWSSKTSYMYRSEQSYPFKENDILGIPDQPLVPVFLIL